MISLLMLHADEGFWAGDKKAEGKLKDLVTGNRHPIEFKGKEAFWINNYVRLLVTGNQDWQVPAGFEERRFAVLDVGDAHQQDHAYFAAIDAEMNAGRARGAALPSAVRGGLLQGQPASNPAYDGVGRAEARNGEPRAWLVARHIAPRRSAGISAMEKVPQNEAPSEALYDDYIEHAKKQGVSRRAIETQLGMFLEKVVGPNLHRSKKKHYRTETRDCYESTVEKRGLVYVFPPLSECRQIFAGLINEEIKWEEGEDWG